MFLQPGRPPNRAHHPQAQKDRDVLAIRSRDSAVREAAGLDRVTELEKSLDDAKRETAALAATYDDACTALHQVWYCMGAVWMSCECCVDVVWMLCGCCSGRNH